MSTEVKKYRVLKPVAISGIHAVGEIIDLSEAAAANIGIGEYLEAVDAPSESQATGPEITAPLGEETPVEDSANEIPANELGSADGQSSEAVNDAPISASQDEESEQGDINS